MKILVNVFKLLRVLQKPKTPSSDVLLLLQNLHLLFATSLVFPQQNHLLLLFINSLVLSSSCYHMLFLFTASFRYFFLLSLRIKFVYCVKLRSHFLNFRALCWCMEIMSVPHFPPSSLSEANLDKLVILNGNLEDVEFHLPYLEERPDNIAFPWVSFFNNHIDSNLRIPPAPFFID